MTVSEPSSGQARRIGLRRHLILGAGVLALLCATSVLIRLQPTRRPPLAPPLGQVADFTLTNQLGQSFTLEQLRGRVWVVDIIFTRCAGPCPQMTRQMRQLQLALPQGKPVTLVTLTTDPEFDTPAVLKDYAGRFEAAPADWQFLTGSKTEIFRLAVESLRLSALEVDPAERASPEDLFVHSTLFVIVDQKAQVRGVVEGTEPDAVDKAVGMIERLLRER